MWVDAHLHLDAEAFDRDRDEVVARAAASGVGALVSAGTTIAGSRNVLALAERYAEVWAAVGVYPEFAGTLDAAGLEALEALARHPRVVAIGEVGLDYARVGTPRRVQCEALRAQVRLAHRLDLPVVVHNREAYDDVEGILRDEGADRVILHCFTGTPDLAVRWANAGWMISLAGPVTFGSAGALRDVARHVPAGRLLVETDAPYLAPAPARGRRCEPADVVHTARAVAGLRGMSPDALEAILEESARRTFGIGPEDRRVRGEPSP